MGGEGGRERGGEEKEGGGREKEGEEGRERGEEVKRRGRKEEELVSTLMTSPFSSTMALWCTVAATAPIPFWPMPLPMMVSGTGSH